MKLTVPGWPESLAARVIIAALTPMFVVGVALIVVPRLTDLPDDAAFQVEDTVVTEESLRNRIDVLEALYGIRPPAEGEQADRFRRDSAKAVAVSIVLETAARDRGIVISDKAARDTLTRVIEQQYGPGGRAAFVELLGNAGASEQDVLDEIKRQQDIARLFEQVTKDVPEVTDADLRRAFEERRDQLVTPEQRHLRNIVVATKEQAEQMLQRARSGVDFSVLAQENSLDQSTRNSGGDLGFVTQQQLASEYADAAFEAPTGSLFGPVQTQFGWNVGQVLKLRPARALQFDQVKDQLRTTLASERAREVWRDWLARQIRGANVQYADGYRPAHPDAPPSETSVPTQPGVEGQQPNPPR
ncbi:MAG: peptidylprolyl isomerase [Pseudonocardiaceae bacterium]|nr:peptidylprolyl isomerase [Pseudonocardiaceae bacterium]